MASSQNDLEITTSDLGGDSTLVLRGEVDLGTAPLLRAEMSRLADAGRTRIRLDLRDVGFMDSQGIHVLAEAHKRLSTTGGALRLIAPSEAVRRLLEVTGLDRILHVEDC